MSWSTAFRAVSVAAAVARIQSDTGLPPTVKDHLTVALNSMSPDPKFAVAVESHGHLGNGGAYDTSGNSTLKIELFELVQAPEPVAQPEPELELAPEEPATPASDPVVDEAPAPVISPEPEAAAAPVEDPTPEETSSDPGGVA